MAERKSDQIKLVNEVGNLVANLFFYIFYFRYETEDVLRILYSIPVLQR